MMHDFLANNIDDLIKRCAKNVSKRPTRHVTEAQLRNGIPMFLSQLTRILEAEQECGAGEATAISRAFGGASLSDIGTSAAAHGTALLELGYTVDQVVNDYGNLCQAITDLAFERHVAFTVDEFRTLNRCLGNAISNAVTEFTLQRDVSIAQQKLADLNERLGFVMHELRNSLNVSNMAVTAMEVGRLPITGATGAVLKRGLAGMGKLIAASLDEVRVNGKALRELNKFQLQAFISEASAAAQLDADNRGCTFMVPPIDSSLFLQGDRDALLAALANLLSNAFKFTKAKTQVSLLAFAVGDQVLIEVADHCGGLRPGDAGRIFTPFTQRGDDKTGLGLGLSIARQSIEANNGTLSVLDFPCVGCRFTINLPRQAPSE
jgi:signal transduction histidine kinase